MSEHPYKRFPDSAFWRKSVASVAPSEVDPVAGFKLRLTPEKKVATAGSCFAQHISRHLWKSGFNYYVVETGHPILPQRLRDAHQYGVFSARYGNIYTARQLLQLFQRAYSKFSPSEDVWTAPDGSVRDPFRPTVQPRGFVSEAEMRADRKQHLAAVRKMFETLDIFVFTLGLTECWISRSDGAAFPLCPGVEGGEFSEAEHAFYNQDVDDVVSDMAMFFEGLKAVNKQAEVVLTVSPVPLIATAVPGSHVLTSTTYSKSVLRVAADTLCRRYDHACYFPSFEIITGAFNRGSYYEADLRNVNEPGVSHVMRLFLRHAAAGYIKAEDPIENLPSSGDGLITQAEKLAEVECDEVALDRD